jgi:hypothetical protein
VHAQKPERIAALHKPARDRRTRGRRCARVPHTLVQSIRCSAHLLDGTQTTATPARTLSRCRLGHTGPPAAISGLAARRRTEPPTRAGLRIAEQAFDGDDRVSPTTLAAAHLACRAIRSVTHSPTSAQPAKPAAAAIRRRIPPTEPQHRPPPRRRPDPSPPPGHAPAARRDGPPPATPHRSNNEPTPHEPPAQLTGDAGSSTSRHQAADP